MTYRLPGERVPVTVDDLTVTVERIGAWAVAHTAGSLAAAFYAAEPGDAELAALRALYEFFVTEAQPAFEVEDHRGRIPPTALGLLRVPLETALGVVGGWIGTLTPESTAADAVLPEGPVRDQVNAELRKARRKRG